MFETHTFEGTLSQDEGKGAWTFVTVPAEYAPSKTYGWGRTPVTAAVDGRTWQTSLWKDTKSGTTLLAVPKKIRKGKGNGDSVEVSIQLREPE
ncbi:MAG: DUF1905 domain-containing protein [Anaerolineae bacterium]